MIVPDEKTFLKLCSKGDLIPVFKDVRGDLETPVSAYYKLARDRKFSFLLESVEGEEKVARFSFIARDPETIIESKNDQLVIIQPNGRRPKRETRAVKDTPLSFIRDMFKRYRFVPLPGLPRFCGGMVGYMSYDIVRFFERIPQKTDDDLKLPDMQMMLAKTLVIFDHRNHNLKLLHCAAIPPKATVEQKRKAYRKAIREISTLEKDLNKPLPRLKSLPAKKSGKLDSNLTRKEYEDMVRRAKKQIRAGEIIQVVLSQRLQTDLHINPFRIYRSLRVLNPSPYMYYLHCDQVDIIGSSPELLVRCEDRVVETRPIAGTRPRGRDEAEDEKYKAELLKDPKEKAEHIMLVDLGRNDLGRICQKGSVQVSDFMAIEKYSHVMHIVSNVRGRLKRSADPFDVLQSCFPAGTLSGAPKIRAMEIIEDLEKQRRGPYGGCIGYFSFSGNLDTCITIRTIVAHKEKAYIQAGAGIVADSDPRKEYEETLNKARAQLNAIEHAHER